MHARAEIADLQEELQEKSNLYLNAIKDRDAGAEKLSHAKESLSRFEALVKQQVDRAMEKERKQHRELQAEAAKLEEKLERTEEEKAQALAKWRSLDEKFRRLAEQQELQARSSGAPEASQKVEQQLTATLEKRDRELVELKQRINYLQDSIEDFMAENKQLRDLAGVPANYGVDREAVKLLDREKIDDFKKLIRVLQEDNYRLEAERARLKRDLRQAAMTYTWRDKKEGKQLSNEHQQRVDEFVARLLRGEAAEPADLYGLRKENEELQRQVAALNDKGFDRIKGQLENLIRDMQGKTGGAGLTPEQFAKMQADNEELKALLRGAGNAFAATGGSARGPTGRADGLTQGSMAHSFYPHVQPPVPVPNFDGSVNRGYSHKFGAELAVTSKNGEARGVDGPDAYDNAFLQLQLQECFELIKRKDDALKAQKREIEQIYARMKKYLLMQDHLYRDHVRQEKAHSKVVEELKATAREAHAAFGQEQLKVQKLEAALQSHQSSAGGEEQKARLVELTKQNSLLEVNLIRMTRKYQALEEQEKLLRRNYENIEADMSTMEVSCLQRINQLKEWKRTATFQLKQMHELLRVAVP